MTHTLRSRRSVLATLPLAFLLLSTGVAPRAGASTPVEAISISAGPLLAEPTAGATVTDVVMRWLPVTGATEYELQVSPNGDWSNNLSFAVTVKGFQYSPPVTLDNGSYFWRVRGSAGTVKGPWSSEGLFTRGWTPVPELLSPADGDLAVSVPTFRWTAISGASRYELQVGPDVNFSPSTYMVCTTDHTSYTPYKGGCNVDPAIGVTYYWRVRGLDDPGNVLGRWSTTRSFLHRKAMPTMTGPAKGSTVSAPVLTWDPVADSE